MPHPAPVHKSFTDRNSLYQEITDKIIAELEQGRVPWVQPWGNARAPLGTPRNAATQRPYSGINILILWMACTERGFTGQNWLTFRQALKIGAHVRKGEKGTTVVYADRFVPYRERTRAADTGDEPEAIPFLKRFTVFNADQCEDLPADTAPHAPSLAPHENLVLPQAEALIRATGADIRIGGNRAFYVPSADYTCQQNPQHSTQSACPVPRQYPHHPGNARRGCGTRSQRPRQGRPAEPDRLWRQ
jgi:antirestriction protein ArdC